MSPTGPTRSRVTACLVYLVFVVTLGPLQFGYHLAELNAPQAVITCERKSIHSTASALFRTLPQCIPMNPSQFGLVSSIYTLGGLLGALLAGPVSTKHGRLFALRATTIFFILGPVTETFAPSIPILSVGRLLSGVGAGAAIVVGPIYISEIAPPNAKGFFGAFTQIMTNVGILFTQTLGYFLSKGDQWRAILAVAGLLGVSELLGLFFVPESPTWLAEHQQANLARHVLQRIRGNGADIEEEIEGWKSSERPTGPEEEESLLTPPSGNLPPKQPPVTILQAVTDPYYRPAIVAVIGVMVAQQFTGINSIIMYSVSLLQSLLPTGAALLTVMISALNLVITLACSPLPDKIGRKTCLLLSISGMGCNSVLLALGIFFNQKILSAIAALLFVASFAVGLGPVPFILASELVGPEAVGATQSWALAANWTATFIVAQFFPVLNDALGGRGKIYWIFAVLACLLGGFIYGWVPETKGKANADEVWGREDSRRRD
ncbi:MFS glucose transporter, putative [Aspergillus lentulus]|uniref:MFS glucose transporter, putative n=1 Tax=Aspergillus lentulus TaxID=293939 RepID=A0ABQ1B5Q1_ASPLE|nr:MFS glucose transporter, putative [Aspergillus lentulus]GFF52689.1 MFS glucose transporter, putative [Aspergillus lentulus]GFF80648.1 MFS glucose transporter, putative [Aspergillus lentulus]GFF94251.1 MFS glucose transporter, putative [Aspergillus lentulus]GFG13682.1 MFS glucose transporter, putative [Aspergillus lentulus]